METTRHLPVAGYVGGRAGGGQHCPLHTEKRRKDWSRTAALRAQTLQDEVMPKTQEVQQKTQPL